jgi:hypothetical protein
MQAIQEEDRSVMFHFTQGLGAGGQNLVRMLKYIRAKRIHWLLVGFTFL